MTGSCIESYPEKMKFFYGILNHDFFIERPYNPGPCQCIKLNHDTEKIEKKETLTC